MLAAGIEIVWLIFIAAFAAGCAYPIYNVIVQDYVTVVIVLAALFAFYFRLVIFFRQIAWLQFLAVQIPLFLAGPVLFILTLGKMKDFTYLFDSFDLYYFIIPEAQLNAYEMNDAFHLFRNEFILFSVGLLIVLACAELRLVMAFVKRIREME